MSRMTKHNCVVCGTEFDVEAYRLAAGKGQCCSMKCKGVLSRKHWSEQIEPITESGCWIWMGGACVAGYGWQRKRDTAGMNLAHRMVYEELIGPIPDGLQLDHLCRVKCCVNPAHLEPVDGRTNTLRGVGPSAMNAKKTHCPKGHELVRIKKQRYCRICSREGMRARRAAGKTLRQRMRAAA